MSNIKHPQLADAQMMHQTNPTTFFAPSQPELDSINEFDWVKICCKGERFWVIVLSINDENITGSINNTLFLSREHNLYDKDLISFQKRNIYQIMKNENQDKN